MAKFFMFSIFHSVKLKIGTEVNEAVLISNFMSDTALLSPSANRVKVPTSDPTAKT